MNKDRIKIAFIGAGSIGSLFGGCLANISSKKYKLDIVFFGRKSHMDAINENGLTIQTKTEQFIVNNITGYTNPQEYLNDNSNLSLDFLFLTTKAYDIKKALEEYSEIIGLTDYLVILQNGIGNKDIVKQFISPSQIIRGITSNGALKSQPGNVKHTGKGFTRLGFPFLDDFTQTQQEEAQITLKRLKKLFILAGFETENVKDIQRQCWEKIFVNIGINAFGALTRLKNGELLKVSELKDLIRDAINEAIQVAKFKGINLEKKDYVEICFDVARKTKNNINSMLQDILKGKKTEIDFINGRIVKYSENEIYVPINRTITTLIKGLEKSEL